jgi:hypothetical protein
VNGEKVCSTFYFVIGCILWEWIAQWIDQFT